MFRALAVLLVIAFASGSLLTRKVRCHPKTEVCVSHQNDAVGEPIWVCKAPVHDALVDIGDSVDKVKICGFGKFTFSPMSCAGGRFQHKAQSVEIREGDGACAVHALTYDNVCYKVEC